MDLGKRLREITVTPATIPIPQRTVQHEPLEAPVAPKVPAEPVKKEV